MQAYYNLLQLLYQHIYLIINHIKVRKKDSPFFSPIQTFYSRDKKQPFTFELSSVPSRTHLSNNYYWPHPFDKCPMLLVDAISLVPPSWKLVVSDKNISKEESWLEILVVDICYYFNGSKRPGKCSGNVGFSRIKKTKQRSVIVGN